MTGLEAILDQIQQEAASQAEELLSAARTEAESTLAAARYGQPGKGVMTLNARDLQRLPGEFSEALAKAAPQGDIEISPAPGAMEGGFVLTYGPVQVDCTFASLFQEAYEQLRDAAGAILFAPM